MLILLHRLPFALRPGEDRAMMFVLEVDLSDVAGDGAAQRELARILRYWAGAMQQLELQPGIGSVIYDSAYRPVGVWTVTDVAGPALD